MQSKKLSLLVLTTSLALALTACGGNKLAESSEATDTSMSVPAAQAGKTDPTAKSGNPEAQAKLTALQEEEKAIFSKNQALWDKLFLHADKNSAMTGDGSNYGDFLLQTLENAKDQFTEAEQKTLKEGAEKIRSIEEEMAKLEKELPSDKDGKGEVSGGKQSSATPFPSFKGTDLDGHAVDSGLFREHAVTVVNFWFSTCSPCIGELDDLDALHKELQAKDGTVIGVNSFTLGGDKTAIAEAKTILQTKKVTYPNITFPMDSEAGQFVNTLMSYPTTIVVDRDGHIIGEPILGSIVDGNAKKMLDERIAQVLQNDANKAVLYDEASSMK